MPRQPTYDLYKFKTLLPKSDYISSARALFSVETTSGQIREELLDLHIVEARIRLWEDQASRDPHYMHHDKRAYLNCREFVHALTEALKRQLV